MKNNPGASELRKLIKLDYFRLNEQLLSYAEMLVNYYLFKSKSVKLPYGKKPIDLVVTVIDKVLAPEGEGRNWNQKETPMFLDFLKSAIKSELSNLITKKENRVKQKIPIYTEEINSDYFDSFSSSSSTEDDLVFKELVKSVESKIKGDPNLMKVFFELNRGVSVATTIMTNTGLGRRNVENSLIKIREIVDSVIKS
ncbi:MAG: hypothetical protein ABJK11_07960 [Balneola sp.]